MQDTSLCGDNILLDFRMFLGIMQHGGCRTLHIGYGKHRSLALQVSHHNSIRMLLLQFDDSLYREFLVYMAATIPELHISSCYTIDIVAQIVVGTKDNLLILWKSINYLLGIAAGHNTVGQGLHGSSSIHIAHYLIARMLFLIFLQILCLAAIGKRTAGIQVWAKHCLVRAQELAGLRHEMNTTHHHHLGIGLGSLAGQSQGITNKVGYVLYLAYGIVVRQDDSILFLTKLLNFSFQV